MAAREYPRVHRAVALIQIATPKGTSRRSSALHSAPGGAAAAMGTTKLTKIATERTATAPGRGGAASFSRTALGSLTIDSACASRVVISRRTYTGIARGNTRRTKRR